MTTRVRNVHGHTLDLIGEAIVAGRYAEGQAIPPEPALCETFGVSRTVIREAIKSLVAKGLIITGPKVGTRGRGRACRKGIRTCAEAPGGPTCRSNPTSTALACPV